MSVGYDGDFDLDFTNTQVRCAERYGYEYKKVTEKLIPDALPTWSKHQAAIDIIESREAVMIIDTDAEVMKTCPPFHRLVADNRRHDIFLALGHSFRPNAGMILLRGGSKSIAPEFLRTILAERLIPSKDKVKRGGDNGHVISVLRRKQFAKKLFLLSPVWNNTMKASDWDHIRHYTGPMREAFRTGLVVKETTKDNAAKLPDPASIRSIDNNDVEKQA
ncbi:hypothetical protein ACYQR9_09695 [Methylobacterium sp. CM6241]